MLTAVVEALEGSALPESCKAMLVAGGRHSLGLFAEERHEHQAMVVALIGDALQASLKAHQAKLAQEEAAAAGADAEKQRLAGLVAAAKGRAYAAADGVAGEENALAAKTDAMMAARLELAELQGANQEADAARTELVAELQDLGKVLEGHFAPIEAGEAEPAAAATHADALLKVAVSLGLDESLRLALPKTCGKTKEERGPFDAMVVEQLGASLRNQHKQLTDMVAAEGPAADARVKAEEESKARVAQAEEAQKAAATSLATARAAMDQDAKGLTEAKKAAKGYEQDFASATAGRDEAKAALENFTSYTLECFDVLKSKEKPKPVEKPAEAPVAEEEAAAA